MFKRIISLLVIVLVSFGAINAQNKKAEKKAEEQAKYEKAKAAIEAKLFALIPDSYEKKDGTPDVNTDESNFILFEDDGFFYLQGAIIAGNKFTNKTEVTEFDLKTDKKGNLFLKMQVSGSAITARVEIQMRNGSNYADVIITPTSGGSMRFSGEVLPKSEAKYYKRPNVV